MSARFTDRLRDVRTRVVRAVRLGFPHEAADAVAELSADLADTGRRNSTRVALISAMEDAGVRRAHGAALADWLIASARGERPFAEQPPRDRYEPPVITIEPGELPLMLDIFEEALAACRRNLFWRAGRLVMVAPAREPGEAESVRAVDLSEDLLIEIGTDAARWEIPGRENSGDAKRVNCPKNAARGLLARQGTVRPGAGRMQRPGLPTLAAVINAPTLRADGSLLDLPGYDSDTGLFLEFGGTAFPEIPERPTRGEAGTALDKILDLLAEVAFADVASRAVALSAILTAVVRPSLPAAPMHAISATTYGTGKSYLTDLISTIATGHTAAPLAAGANDEEFEKRLGAALMAGQAVIVLDNATRPVNGDLLNQVLTQERVNPRRLGKSENVEIHCTAFMMMNGNNLAIPADMTRRVLMCSLDARTEQPESREFHQNPLAMVRASRGDYVAAALTVLRGYIAADRPGALRPLGSFEAWSALVRGALVWLGEVDPVESMNAVRAADPYRQNMVAVMSNWSESIGNARVSISDVIARAVTIPEFRESLLAVAGDHGAIKGIRLGSWLGRNKGRIVDARSFVPAGQRKGIALWRLDGAREVSTGGTVHALM